MYCLHLCIQFVLIFNLTHSLPTLSLSLTHSITHSHSVSMYATVSILLYKCTTWTQKKYSEKLRSVLNKFWKQHPTKQHANDHLHPISRTFLVKLSKHMEYCWRNKDEHISEVLIWTRVRVHMRTSLMCSVLTDQQELSLPLFGHWMHSSGHPSSNGG